MVISKSSFAFEEESIVKIGFGRNGIVHQREFVERKGKQIIRYFVSRKNEPSKGRFYSEKELLKLNK